MVTRRSVRGVSLCLAIALASLTATAARAGTPLPKVQEDTPLAGIPFPVPTAFHLNSSSSSARMTTLMTFFSEQLIGSPGAYTGFTLGPLGIDIRFQLFGDQPPLGGLPAVVAPFAAMGEEGYVLYVTWDANELRVIVASNTDHGLWNGAMTLLQLLLTDDSPPVAESTIGLRVIRDYPDNPIRAGHLLDTVVLAGNGFNVPFSVTPQVRANLDALARKKLNWFIFPNEGIPLSSKWWDDAPVGLNGKQVYAELQQYCADRFIEFVPTLGNIGGAVDIPYRDSWWVHDEPFRFVSKSPEYLVTGDFESDYDVDLVPDGWSIVPLADPLYGTWTYERSFGSQPGGRSMKLTVPNVPCSGCPANQQSTNLYLRQASIPVPGPGSYRVAAKGFLASPGLQGTADLQVTLVQTKADGSTPVTSVVFLRTDQTDTWIDRTSPTAITVAPGDGTTSLTVYSRLFEGGYGTAYLDDVRIVRDGETQVEEAVAESPPTELATNGGFETDANGDGFPDGWTNPGTTWTRDASERHSDSYSMRVTTPDTSMIQWSVPAAPGDYRVSLWFKSQATGTGQLTIFAGDAGDNDSHLQTVAIPPSPVWKQGSAIVRVPEGAPNAKIKIYSRLFDPTSTGPMWIDDVSVRRIDGDLRHVVRKNYELRVTPNGGGAPYVEGQDYEVIDGNLALDFSYDQPPTRLRRLGNQIPLDTTVRVSYDKNLYYLPYFSGGKQSFNLCTDSALDEVYAPGAQRLLVDLPNASGIPVTALNLVSDEIRGLNRSGACRNPDGSLRESNGELVARFLNDVSTLVHGISPSVNLFVWDDMFYIHNGYNGVYQSQFGGSPGPTGCATDASLCSPPPASLLDPSVGMLSWWYSNTRLFQRDASATFFANQGRTQLLATLGDLVATRDAAAVLPTRPLIQGLIATDYEHDPNAIPLTLDLGWNLESEQVAYANFEASQAELVGEGYSFSGASVATGTCPGGEAAAASISTRRDLTGAQTPLNPQGVCASAGGSVALPWLDVDNSSSYEVIVEARSDTAVPGAVTLHWRDASGAEQTNAVPVSLGGSDKDFVRASVTPVSPPSGPPTAQLRVELAASAIVSLDNLIVRRSRGGCPDGRVVVEPPPAQNLGSLPAGSSYDVSLDTGSLGCEDLRVTGIHTVPAGRLSFASTTFPVIIRPGTNTVIQGSGVAPGPGMSDEYVVVLETNGNLPPTEVDVTLSTPCVAGNSGWLDPSNQQAQSGGDNDGFESNPTRAFADDPNTASYAANMNGTGDRHSYYDYGVPIPPLCQVKGIEVRLDWWLSSTSGTNTMSAELSWNTGASWTGAKATSAESTSQRTDVLGSASDVWGRTWTPAELSNANLRVRLTSTSTGSFTSSSRDFFLDWVPIRVTWGP